MLPTRLTLSGFGSYQHLCELDLTGIEVCAVTGNNGAGKSTLFESILWVLFGVATDRTATEIINTDSTHAHVELGFALDGQNHTFKRERSASKHRAWYEGSQGAAETPREVAAIAKSLLHCDADLLSLTALARQGNIGQFASLPTSERRSKLTDAILQGMFDDAESKSQEYAQQYQQQMSELVGELKRVKTDAAGLKDATKREKSAHIEADEISARTEALEARSAEIDYGHFRKVQEAAKRLDVIQEEITDLEEGHTVNKKQYHKVADGLEDLQLDLEDAQNEHDAKSHAFAVAQSKAVDAPKQLKAYKEVLSQADDESSETHCEFCGSILTYEVIECESKRLEKLITSENQHRVTFQNSQQALTSSKREYKQAQSLAKQLNSDILNHDRRVEKLEAEESLLNPLAAELDTLKTRMQDAPSSHEVEAARKERNHALRAVGRAEESVDMARSASKKLPKLEKKVEALSEIHDSATTLAKALRPSGVPHLALEERLAAIVAASNDALHTLGDMQLRFVTESQTVGGRPPLRIEASLGAEDWRQYATFSGGERMRLDIAMRIGFCRAIGINFKTLIMDEGWGALDSTSSVSLSNLLSSLVARGEVAAVYSISHIRSAVDGFLSQIEVTKESGTSRAVVLY